jgi:hypothetical protein
MKILTLHEKITLKGELARRGAPPSLLVRLTAATAACLHWRGYGRPMSTRCSPTPKE